MWRDPWGFTGSEMDRPALQAVAMAARRNADFQEQCIQMHCQVGPALKVYKYPHYPPSDATRNDPSAFAIWRSRQEFLRDLAHLEGGSEELSMGRSVWRIPGGPVLEEMQMRERNKHLQAYVWWDADLNCAIACDHRGRWARGSSG